MKGMLRYKKCYFAVAIVVLMILCTSVTGNATARQKVQIGKTISLAKKGAAYQSADTSIAYVNEDGRVTGKKEGTTTITVKKGSKSTKYTVDVTKNGKKNYINVCADEIQVSQQDMEYTPVYDENDPEWVNAYRYTATLVVKNAAKKKAGKITVVGMLGDTKQVYTCKSLEAGAKKRFTIEGIVETEDDSFEITKVKVVSRKMISCDDRENDMMKLVYALPDTTAPVIKGFVGKDSYNDKIPYRIVYSDNYKSYDYLKCVTAEDDRDTKVRLSVDTSKVNFKKAGTYTITYIAKDDAGNTAKAKARLGVRVPDTLEEMSDDILKSIVKPSWSNERKARAIYKYVRGHISYTGTSDKSGWEKDAVRGIRYGTGDCFTYYALSRALLTRAGIMNIEVTRVQGHGHHWWNMVYLDGLGFYHFDTCPRSRGGNFCLVTDAQLKDYSKNYGNSHIWAYDKKPKSATKVISSIF